MSDSSGKKRKSLTSPPNQASISKFFKSNRSPKKLAVKLDNDDVVVLKKTTENRKQETVPNAFVLDKKQKEKLDLKKEKLSHFVRKDREVPVGGDEKENEESSKFFDDASRKDDGVKNGKLLSNDSVDKVKVTTEEVIDKGIMFKDIKKLKRKVTFTPLEQQVVAIKTKHLDVLLFVECGYRYRFFGEDAEAAAKELDIQAHLDKNFLTASIPVHRLMVHVSRLVEKGYKVGIVSQTETAALKASGDNKNAPFTRKLSQVYTKATFIDREENEESISDITSGRYIISVSEVTEESSLPFIALLCANPTSGDITCLNIDVDENLLSKLETVFCALKPSEIVMPETMSNAKKAEEYMQKYCKLEDARAERVKPSVEISIDPEKLRKKLGDEGFNIKGIMKCISLTATYLKEFQLENLVSSLRNYRLYSLERKCMHIDGCTLKNLEILENEGDKTVRGSLLSIMDHTVTVFGKRLMRRWVIQPLISVKQINKRLEAVGELVDNCESTAIKDIKKQFHGCPDIEKNLNAIFFHKITPDKFVKTMETLAKLNNLLIQHMEELNENFNSSLLKSIFERIPKLLGTDVDDLLGTLDKEAAAKGDKVKLFLNVSAYPRIVKAQEKIKEIENTLEEYKNKDLRKLLGGPVEYKSVSGSGYLVEVKNKELSKVPGNWVKVNSTKQVARFRPLFVEENYKKLCQTQEKLKIAADAAWESFLNDFSDMYDFCRKAVLKFAELDCLLSLAIVAKQVNHCRPIFDEDCSSIEIIGGRHPVLSTLLADNQQYVANDIHLDDKMKAMILSGPNMGGKSSFIRQVAVICIMAQIGSYVPAESAKLCPIDGVYTRMGSSDDIAKGKSTFMVELEQASMIMREATSKSLVILDELGRGTSTYDGMAIAFATLKYFLEEKKSFTLFVTHYAMLSELEKLYPKNVTNQHMAFMSATDDDDDDDDNESTPSVQSIIFLYKLIQGAAQKSYGLNVARLAGITDKILKNASLKSSSMEKEVQGKINNFELLKTVFSSERSVAAVKELVLAS